MSFFDPQIMHEPLPEGWENYELHTEVNDSDIELIRYLEETKWEHFTYGGVVIGTQGYVDESAKTRWYGLNRNVLKKS